MEVTHAEVVAVMGRLYPEHLRVCVLTVVNEKQAQELRGVKAGLDTKPYRE